MSANNQIERAELFRSFLNSPDTMVLPEVWDVATARVLVEAGFPMIGTSATAVAWSYGYRPHERVKLEELLMVAARVARGCPVPLNGDLEGGVGRSVSDVKRAVQAAIAVGCAGVTLGDGSRNGAHGVMPVEEMANRVKAARAAAMETKVPVVLTARTEVFELGPLGQSPLDAAISRAEAYFDAGADCILVPGIQHVSVVQRLVENVPGPLSISIGLSSAPNVSTYADIGVSCVALGSSVMRSMLGTLRNKAEELLAFGNFAHLDRAISQDELEALLR